MAGIAELLTLTHHFHITLVSIIHTIVQTNVVNN